MNNEDRELRLKHRPKSFDEFYGNQSMIKSLKSVLDRDSGVPHCIMFEGSSGCGKSTLALIVAKELGCKKPDYREYNISDTSGIDTAREIIKIANYAPLGGGIKVYVLNEAHRGTIGFWNAMLDVLEQPPNHLYFIICTTEPEKIVAKLKTIRNQRAMVFKVSELRKNEAIKFLKDICSREGVEFSNEIINEIVSVSDYSPRNILTILDQVIDIDSDKEVLEAINDLTISETTIKELCQYLLSAGKKGSKKIRKLLKGIDLSGNSAEEARNAVKGWMGTVYLNSGNERAYEIMTLFLEPFYSSGREGFIDAVVMASKI